MVYAPDYTDENALQRRLYVRERHMTAAKGLHGLGHLSAQLHLVLGSSFTCLIDCRHWWCYPRSGWLGEF